MEISNVSCQAKLRLQPQTNPMKRYVNCLVVAAAVASTTLSAYAGPNPATQSVFTKLMTATIADNYDAFITQCDDRMKAAITKPALESVSKKIAPRAKEGYDAQYLGELNQRGYEVNLWRLRFKDGGDDALATLSMKDGKAGGFFLH